MTPETTCQR